MKPQSLELELLYPTLLALDSLGGSGSIHEIVPWVVEHEGYGEDVTSPMQGEGPRTVFEYRMAWARTILKQLELVASGGRGVWIITEAGTKVLEKANPIEVLRRLNHARRQPMVEPSGRNSGIQPDLSSASAPAELFSFNTFVALVEEEDSWKPALLETILRLSPKGFEHLTLRLLREHGLENLEVMGGPSDGGIDGVGDMRLGLLRFPMVFQCKRYVGSVGPSIVRDFRGAMQGRTDKGLLITTGRFTREAELEATRAGTSPIDLIDGDQLCELMRDAGLGLRTVTKIALDDSFFDDYRVV
jgi:restriction system protein